MSSTLDRLRRLVLRAAPALRPPVALPMTADTIVARLEAARTQEEALAVLGRLVGLAETDAHEVGWSPDLRQLFKENRFHPDLALALTRWALEASDPWTEAYAEERPGSPNRQAALAHPHTLAALLVLEWNRNRTGIGVAPVTTRAEAMTVWSDLNDSAPVNLYDAWREWGLSGPSMAALEGEMHALSKRHCQWLVAHPATPTSLRVRAAARLVASDREHTLLDTPWALSDISVRRACWEHGNAEGALLEAMVGLIEPAEFAQMVTTLSHLGRYTLMGNALEWGSPQQRAAVRARESEFALWCTRVAPQHRSLVIGLAGAVTPAARRTP